MAKKVTITLQGLVDSRQSNVVKEITVDDDFELYDDYYVYQIGLLPDAHDLFLGNS